MPLLPRVVWIPHTWAHEGASGVLVQGFYGVAGVPRPSAYTQTYATAAKTVPAATQLTPPAGGTGATAGAYDTAANRDLMIASITAGSRYP